MRIFYTPHFRRSYKKAPKKVQQAFASKYP
jgi:mRNA-degrading endonuclease RelE of RelBE toxin-antitoxin system